VFQVRAGAAAGGGADGPWTYTVGANDKVKETWTYSNQNSYDLTVYGPNGFMRAFAGSLSGSKANLKVETDYDCSGNGLDLKIQNRTKAGVKVHVYDAYRRQTIVQFIGEGDQWRRHFPLAGSFGWYDLTVQVEGDGTFNHRVAGHVETGEESATDPALGAR
jgi:phospholipase C